MSTTRQARQGMYAKMTPHDAVVHSLTAYDRKMANRKGHNPRFLGIALVALHDAEADMPDATLPDLIGVFCGRVLGHLIRDLDLAGEWQVGRWGDLERIPPTTT